MTVENPDDKVVAMRFTVPSEVGPVYKIEVLVPAEVKPVVLVPGQQPIGKVHLWRVKRICVFEHGKI